MTCLFSTSLFASASIFQSHKNLEIDKTEKRNNLELKTGKVDDTRVYHVSVKTYYKTTLEKLTQSILNFPSRCNNEYKDLREHTDKNFDCPFHNPNMIETLSHKVTKELPNDKAIVVTRYVNNRGRHVVNELVTLDKKNIAGRDMVMIHIQSISDAEAKELTGKDLVGKVALKRTWAKFTLYPTDDGRIEFKYTYEMETDHWLINKSVAASSVFDNMENSLNTFVKTLTDMTVTEKKI